MPDDVKSILGELRRKAGVPATPAAGVTDRGDPTVATVLDDEFAKLGYGSTQRLSMLGDVGRENSWDRKTIFGGHADPKNKAFNRGIISWQGDRRKKLDEHLKAEGVLGKGDDDELRAMARFMDKELKEDFGNEYHALRNARTTAEASEALQKYIKYVPKAPYNTPDPNFRVKNNADWAKRAKKLGLAADNTAPPAIDGKAELSKLLGRITGGKPSPTFPGQPPVPVIPPFPDGAPVPERPDTLEAQREAANDPVSTRAAVLHTPGGQIPPKMPGEVDIQLVDGNLLRANAAKLDQYFRQTRTTMFDLRTGKSDFTPLLGGKTQVTNDTAGKPAVVTRDAQTGMELVASMIETPDAAEPEAALQKAQFPNRATTTEIMPPEAVTGLRDQSDLVIETLGGTEQASIPDGYDQFIKDAAGQYGYGTPESFVAFKDAMASMPVVPQEIPSQQPKTSGRQTVAPVPTVKESLQVQGKNIALTDPDENKGRPTPKDEKVTLQWSRGGDALTNALDQAATEYSNRIGVDYALVRERMRDMQPRLTPEKAEQLRRENKPYSVTLEAATVRELQAEQDLKSNQDFAQKDRERQASEFAAEYEAGGEIASVAALMGLKDVAIDKLKNGQTIDEAIAEERSAYDRALKDIQGVDELRAVRRIDTLPPEQREAALAAIQQERADKIRTLVQETLTDHRSFVGKEKNAERIEKEYKYRPLARPLEATKTFGSYIAKLPAKAAQAGLVINELSPTNMILDAVGVINTKPSDNPVWQWAEQYEKGIDSYKNKDFKDEFLVNELPEAFAQFATQAVLAPATGGLSLAIPMAEAGLAQYKEADKAGANKASRLSAAAFGALAGAPDVLIKAKFLKFLTPADKQGFIFKLADNLTNKFGRLMGRKEAEELSRVTIAGALKKGAFGFGVEYTQERSEDVLNKAFAKITYKPELTWEKVVTPDKGAEKGYLAAGIVGTLGGGVETVTQNMAYDQLVNAESILGEMFKSGKITSEQVTAGVAAAEKELQTRVTDTGIAQIAPSNEAPKDAQPVSEATIQPVKEAESVPQEPVLVDNKGREFTLVEDKGGDNILVKNEKGGIIERKRDKLKPKTNETKTEIPKVLADGDLLGPIDDGGTSITTKNETALGNSQSTRTNPNIDTTVAASSPDRLPVSGTRADAVLFKPVADGPVRDSQPFRDLANSKPFADKGLRGLDAPSREMVMARVIAVLHDPKVRDVVVELIPVDVVDDFISGKLSTDASLNNKTMLQDEPSVNLDLPVPAFIDTADAIIGVLAGERAKNAFPASGDATRGGLNADATMEAGDKNRGSVAVSGTKSSSGLGELGRGTIEDDPATSTRSFHNETSISQTSSKPKKTQDNKQTRDVDVAKAASSAKPKGPIIAKGAELETKSGKPKPLSNTQVEFSPEQAKPFDDFRRTVIDPADVADRSVLPEYAKDGLFEIKPHVTVKYGLTTNTATDVEPTLKGEKPITLELGKTSVFRGSEKKIPGTDKPVPYDVVIVAVKSPDLERLNTKLTEGHENTTTFPYSPHVTLAYVKLGMGEKYADRADFEGQKFTFDGVTFSPADKSGKSVIPLGGKGEAETKVKAPPTKQRGFSFAPKTKEARIVAGGEINRDVQRRDTARREAETDELTGLGNRKAFNRVIAEAESDPNTTVAVGDLNNFKAVNDTLGHTEGDRLLKLAADAMQKAATAIKGTKGQFRPGGDEFVGLPNSTEAEKFKEIAEKEFGQHRVGEKIVSLSISLGNTFAEADATLNDTKTTRKIKEAKAAGLTATDREGKPLQASRPPKPSKKSYVVISLGPYHIEAKPLPNLSTREKSIQSATIERVRANPQKYIDLYNKLELPKVLDPDKARVLFDEYNRDPLHNTNAVHAASAAVVRLLLKKQLAELPAGSRVLLTAGGPASGKSSAFKGENVDLVYDTVMWGKETNRELIDQVAESGHQGILGYVHRPVENATVAMLRRLKAEGRPVAFGAMTFSHFNAQKVFIEDTYRYALDRGLEVLIFETVENEASRPITLEDLKEKAYSNLEEVENAVKRSIDEEFQAGEYGRGIESLYRPALSSSVDEARSQPNDSELGKTSRGTESEGSDQGRQVESESELPLATIQEQVKQEFRDRRKDGRELPDGLRTAGRQSDKVFERHLERYVSNMGDGFIRDWHSMIYKPAPTADAFIEETGLDPIADKDISDNLEASELSLFSRTPPNTGNFTLDSIYNKDGSFNYEQITDVAGRIERGELEIVRLDRQGERGRIKGGQRNVEASIILAADERSSQATSATSGAGMDSHADTVKRQEKLLEAYAKREGIWFSKGHFPDRLYIGRGGEAFVYQKDETRVAKLVDPRHIDKGLTPQKFIDNRISLFNTLFPESHYELMGFTRDENGKFRFIVTQPFIQGVKIKTQADVDAVMAERGMDRTDRESYSNNLYQVHDLHVGNVLKDADGNIYVIDAVPKMANEANVRPFEVAEQDDGSTLRKAAEPNPQTKTEAFKKWFGDWQNSSGPYDDEVSQMVDSRGRPQIFYHRTNAEFDAFDPTKHSTNTDAGWLGEGFYFYGDESEAYGYGDKEIQAYLNIRNPYYATVEDFQRLSEANDAETSKEFTDRLKDEGYDGVYYNGDLRQEAVAFYPTQIKSATDNSGAFDPDEYSILKQAAWHGSPHKFDKFSTEKIGTGEGAQAYGYGLYFTDTERIAEHYKNVLTQRKDRFQIIGDNPIPAEDRNALNAGLRTIGHRNLEEGIKWLESEIQTGPGQIQQFTYPPMVNALRKYQDRIIEASGAKYKVDLKPAESEYLLWDKPLSEQSETVRDAVNNALSPDVQSEYKKLTRKLDELDRAGKLDTDDWNAITEQTRKLRRDNPLLSANGKHGQTLYQDLAYSMGQAEASEYLKSLGIRGIKYLDGISRNSQKLEQLEAKVRVAEKRLAFAKEKGDASLQAKWEQNLADAQKELGRINYNYVIFDDADVEITEIMYRKRSSGIETTLDEIEGADLAELLSAADTKTLVKDEHRIETASVEIYEIVRRAIEQVEISKGKQDPVKFDAIYLDPQQVKDVGTVLRDGAREAEQAGVVNSDVAKIISIADTLDAAAKSGDGSAVIYMFDDALPHEEWHRAGYQQAVDKKLHDRHEIAALQALSKSPVIKKLRRGAFSKLYPRSSDPVAVEEAAAWLAGGGRERLNEINREMGVEEITEDEAKGFLTNWVWSFKQKNPDADLSEFAKINEYANRIIEHTVELLARDADAGSSRTSESDRGDGVEGRDRRRGSGNDESSGSPPSGTESESADGEVKTRKTVISAEAAGVVPTGAITGDARYYTTKSRDANERKAQERIESIGLGLAIQEAQLNVPVVNSRAEHMALQMEVAKLLNKQADEAISAGFADAAKAKLGEAQQIVSAMAEQGTEFGQAISQLANWQKTDPDAVTGYVQKRRAQQGHNVALTPDEAKVLKADATELRTLNEKISELEIKVAALEKRLETKRKSNPVKTEIQKKVAELSAAAQARLSEKFSVQPLQMARPLSALKTSQLDAESLTDFAEIGAAIILEGDKGNPITKGGFAREMAARFGRDIDPHISEIFGKSLDELKRIRSEAYRERAIDALRDIEGNEDLTIEDLNAIVDQNIAVRKEKAKLRGQQVREAGEYAKEIKALEKLDQIPNFARSLFKVADTNNKEALVGALYLEIGSVTSADGLANKLREVFPELSAREALNTASVAAQSRKLAREDIRLEREKLRKDKSVEDQALSLAKRERNAAQRQLLRRIKYLEGPPPSFSKRLGRSYRAALVSAVQTTVNNFVTAQITRKIVSATDLGEVLINKTLAKIGKEYVYDNALDSKTRLGDVLDIPQGKDYSTADIVKHWFSDAIFARGIANSVLDEYPTIWEEMFGSYASDVEVQRDMPGAEGVRDKAMQAVEKTYEALNTLNYFQEFLVRSQEFNRALQLRIGSRGLNIQDVIKDGKVSDNVTADDLIYAVNRALEVTFALQASKDKDSVFAELIALYQKRAPGLLAPLFLTFPNFMYNATRFITSYAPGVGLVKAGVKAGKDVKKGDAFGDAVRQQLNPRVAAQQMVGTALFLAMLGVVSLAGDDDKWYLIRTPFKDENGEPYYIDVRGWQPLAATIFMASKFNRLISGKPMFSSQTGAAWEILEATVGLSNRNITDNKLIESIYHFGLGASNQGDGRDWERSSYLLQQLGGDVTGGFIRPLKTVKDIVAQFSEYEAALPDALDRPFVQGVARSLPWSNQLIGLEPQKDFVTGKTSQQPAPMLKLLGVSVVSPSRHREIPSLALVMLREAAGYGTRQRDILPDARRETEVKFSLYKAIRNAGNDPEKLEQINKAIKNAEAQGRLRPGQLEYIERGKGLSELESLAKSASVATLRKTLRLATDAEILILNPALVRKENNEDDVRQKRNQRSIIENLVAKGRTIDITKNLSELEDQEKLTAAEIKEIEDRVANGDDMFFLESGSPDEATEAFDRIMKSKPDASRRTEALLLLEDKAFRSQSAESRRKYVEVAKKHGLKVDDSDVSDDKTSSPKSPVGLKAKSVDHLVDHYLENQSTLSEAEKTEIQSLLREKTARMINRRKGEVSEEQMEKIRKVLPDDF